jgi:hypothetical protein
MIKYKIKIYSIELLSDSLIITSTTQMTFSTTISKGSIGCKIYNESNQEVSLYNIIEGSLITIYTNSQDVDQKKTLIIKKIITKNNYVLENSSSEEIDDID